MAGRKRTREGDTSGPMAGAGPLPWDSRAITGELDDLRLSTLLAEVETADQILDRMATTRSAVERTQPAIARFCREQLRLAWGDLSRARRAREHSDGVVDFRASARRWIETEYDSDDECVDVASFEGCCLTLGIEPTRLRAVLLAIPEPRCLARSARRTPRIQPALVPRGRGRPPKIMVARAA